MNLVLKITFEIFYLFSFIVYLFIFLKKKYTKEPLYLLLLGFIAHTIYLVKVSLDLGHIPFNSSPNALTFFSWIFILSYLGVRYLSKEYVMAIFALPLALIANLISWFSDNHPFMNSQILKGLWPTIHFSTLTLAYVSFAFAFITSLMYLFLFREIKSKKLGIFYKRLPSLTSLENLNQDAIYTGFVLLTIGIISGFIWNLTGLKVAITRDPRILISFVIWILYFASIHLRINHNWRGIRIIYASVIGFILITFGFIFLRYFYPFIT